MWVLSPPTTLFSKAERQKAMLPGSPWQAWQWFYVSGGGATRPPMPGPAPRQGCAPPQGPQGGPPPLPQQAEELIGPQHSLQPPAAVCLGPPSPCSMLSTRPSVATVGKRGTRRAGKRWGVPRTWEGTPEVHRGVPDFCGCPHATLGALPTHRSPPPPTALAPGKGPLSAQGWVTLTLVPGTLRIPKNRGVGANRWGLAPILHHLWSTAPPSACFFICPMGMA